MRLLQPCLDYAGFGRCDLVIEAIIESLDVKRQVFAELAGKVGEEAILASNTSSLSIDLIARDTPGTDRVIGMHFFNPVHRMPLVEVIRGTATSDRTVSTVMAFARQLGKTPVVVGNGPGFLVNRLLGFYMVESLWLLDERHAIEDIDRCMTDWGMPMGPLALIDEVGIDVAIKVAHILAEAFQDRLPLPDWVDKLPQGDQLGTKSGRGLYRYQNGKRRDCDPEVYGLLGLEQPRRDSDPARLVDRMILPMVNEGSRCLEEGMVRSPAELDLAMILGTGFPPFRGGLCRWADRQGLRELKSTMDGLSSEVGDRFTPSRAFERAVAAGGLYDCYGPS
jgi:3-hydroxyacyl-CoA dehydrogenase/enoyl-CoA hydratase/3-hydroxybutyryl-CoA epimerase